VQDLPIQTYKNLLKYQKAGIEFALEHYGRILLGDEMGVGKTLQAIWIARIYQEDWPLLILCPSALKLNWQDELNKWLQDLPKDEIQILNTNKDKFLVKKQVSLKLILGLHNFLRHRKEKSKGNPKFEIQSVSVRRSSRIEVRGKQEVDRISSPASVYEKNCFDIRDSSAFEAFWTV
jgi:SNF2 family DNA or RNA helicase